jgi:hypothetical protein
MQTSEGESFRRQKMRKVGGVFGNENNNGRFEYWQRGPSISASEVEAFRPLPLAFLLGSTTSPEQWSGLKELEMEWPVS